MNTLFYVDGADRGAVNALKVRFGEPLSWESGRESEELIHIIPVNFQQSHKQMLSHLHQMVAQKYLVIPEEHDKLVISLRTAYAKELSLDKEQTNYDDLFDALRLSLKSYSIE
jgi:hypothetical protein